MRRVARGVLLLSVLVAAGCSNPKEPPLDTGVSGGVHPAGWIDPGSGQFHGSILAAKDWDNTECRPCHGNDYGGGLVEVSCRTCHPSYPHGEDGWIGGHSEYVRNNGWDIVACRPCHGEDYSIRKGAFSCRTCHHAGGPESCNTCHGDFPGDPGDLAAAAPPEGLLGETDPLALPVGAHAAHMGYDPTRTPEETCGECHVVPENYEDPGHIDGQPGAEVVFGGPRGLVPTEGGTRVPAPVWDRATATCSNTYCHGNWGLRVEDSDNQFIYAGPKIEGESASPSWIDPATAACGSCHGLPPTGHDPAGIGSCQNCHEGVIDGGGVIIDPSLHGNGRINLFGGEYPMF